MKRVFVFICVAVIAALSYAESRWQMADDGSIVLSSQALTGYNDHVEMSGKRVSVVLRYAVKDDGSFTVNKGMVWPMLRTVPNNTHASLMRRIEWDLMDNLVINNYRATRDKVERVTLKGTLKAESRMGDAQVTRTWFPSTEQPALIEIMEIKNEGNKDMKVTIPYYNNITLTDPAKGVKGSYAICCMALNPQTVTLKPGEKAEFYGIISGEDGNNVQGSLLNVKWPTANIQCKKELEAREALVAALQDNLVLKTPDEVINRMFAFSKVRACESIYETAGGPMHGPGGESYYAAIWANDQAEYVNPYFPFTGYAYGNASALNSYKMFARFMNNEMKPIPSSIIAEGTDIWNGAGDRGDAAMIAYGAARYVLTRGDKEEARELWPLIKWCLEYCKQKLNDGGVVKSDADELEGRFPAGEANLCTSSLYYDALVSASYLAPLMGEPATLAKTYAAEAKQLRKNINTYFAGPIEGFNTYIYYKGNDVLRSWICIPLVMGINEKAAGTLDALFSPRLWTVNGMLTQAGDKTFWDRTTLYALRGAFYVGDTERALDFLHRYSETRLLGDHVPYAIEAWPEGSQRHLSAESGLYGRIITEGLFGIRPTGFNSFDITPHLPSAWPQMELRHIRAFGSDFDIKVERVGSAKAGKVKLTVSQGNKTQTFAIRNGETKKVVL
ncbi:MAG: hypothetical protein J5678_01095 [Bacteroidaceae bacterium]|nr:hypothetical protein [Bacteroidaceae bacterium]